MQETIRKTVEIDGWGKFEGEFIQTDRGWLCREVNGMRWNFRDWGAQAPMDTPEDAAEYLMSLNIEDKPE